MKPKHKQAYMETAYVFARCSVGQRLKVGAVVVKDNRIISCGYNALPEHMDGPLEDENGNTRPEVRHAEMNSLLGVMKSHNTPVGAAIFCTHSCCKACAVEMVDAGIKEFYYAEEYRNEEGINYLKENGVSVARLDIPSGQSSGGYASA